MAESGSKVMAIDKSLGWKAVGFTGVRVSIKI